MTAKAYLSQPYWIDRKIDRLQEEIDRLRAKLLRATAQLTGMPHGSATTDWTEADVAILGMEAELNAQIAELCRIKREVFEVIDRVESAQLREILEMRYRNYYSLRRIAKEAHYSEDYVRHLHTDALDAVRTILKHDTQ